MAVETIAYRVVFEETRLPYALGVSASANGASYAAGLVLGTLGWP